MISPDADAAVAVCTRSQAETLVHYDHHRVKVGNRWGIMITHPWLPLEEARDPLLVKVIFNPAPKYNPSSDQIRAIVFKHPLAPQEIQDMIVQLNFEDALE